MDEIAQWLQREGLHTQPVYLPDSALLLGQQFELPPYQVIYRIEAGAMIICGFSRAPGSHCQPQQLFHLWGMLRRLLVQYPWLKQIQALVLTETFGSNRTRQRRQLQRVLLSLGAVFTPYDGDNWLVLAADKLISRRLSPY